MELNLPTSREILKLVAHIDRFRGAWSMEAALPPERLARLREAARVHSVASSCRLIGIRITDTEAAALLRGETPIVQEGAAVLGNANALDAAFPRDGALVTPARDRPAERDRAGGAFRARSSERARLGVRQRTGC